MEYSALNQGQIRLILLKPGNVEDSLELSLLQNVQLGAIPLYHGLSYTWGNANDTEVISVNNCKVPVARNLAICLWHLRQTLARHVPIRLWIDAICINQQDNEEKRVQILLMRKIYEQAASTIIWLGPETVDTQYALSLMEKWWDHERSGMQAEFVAWLWDKENAEWIKRSWLACASFGLRAWFLRVWIVQEVIVSARTIAYCGLRPLALEFIAKSLAALAPLPPIRRLQDEMYLSVQNPEYPRLYHAFRTMSLSSYQLGHILNGNALRAQGRDLGSLFELLWRHRNTGATNPRDKIYAMLGLLGRGDNSAEGVLGYSKELLVVDYHATMTEVFKSVVRAVVHATGNLNILCASQNGMYQADSNSVSLQLPSWVPDWSKEWIEQDLLWAPWPNKALGSRFRAAGSSSAEIEFDSDIMRVSGLVVDTIVEIWDELPFLKYMDVPRPQEIAHIRKAKAWRQYNPSAVYPSLEAKAEAHWRTLVANAGVNCDDGPADDWAQVYHEWMSEKTTADNKASFLNRVNMVGMRRRILSSKNGCLVMGPDTTMPGDILCIFLGCDMPVLLRGRGPCFELVGICFVHGIMNGEMMESVKLGNLQLRSFDIL